MESLRANGVEWADGTMNHEGCGFWSELGLIFLFFFFFCQGSCLFTFFVTLFCVVSFGSHWDKKFK